MAVAQPVARVAPTDAKSRGRSVTDGAVETAGAALDERVGFAFQRGQRLFEQRAQRDDARQIFFGTDLAFDAMAREHLDIFGQRTQFFAADLVPSSRK
jgi:hypothetical protein